MCVFCRWFGVTVTSTFSTAAWWWVLHVSVTTTVLIDTSSECCINCVAGCLQMFTDVYRRTAEKLIILWEASVNILRCFATDMNSSCCWRMKQKQKKNSQPPFMPFNVWHTKECFLVASENTVARRLTKTTLFFFSKMNVNNFVLSGFQSNALFWNNKSRLLGWGIETKCFFGADSDVSERQVLKTVKYQNHF